MGEPGIGRRDFLKAGAIVTAGITLAPDAAFAAVADVREENLQTRAFALGRRLDILTASLVADRLGTSLAAGQAYLDSLYGEFPAIRAQQTEETPDQLRDKHHFVADTKPYMNLPFGETHIRELLASGEEIGLTEEWLYTHKESSIHKVKEHKGLDFKAPEGTEVLFDAYEGYIMGSYHLAWARDENGQIIHSQGQPVRYSLGLFAQAYIPGAKRYARYAHLSELYIPFSEPEQVEGSYNPKNHNLQPNDMMNPANNSFIHHIKRGDPIGRVGSSGLTHGDYQEFMMVDGQPFIIRGIPSWDETHLHRDELLRDPVNGLPTLFRDPLSRYSRLADDAVIPLDQIQPGPRHLMFVENGQIRFAA